VLLALVIVAACHANGDANAQQPASRNPLPAPSAAALTSSRRTAIVDASEKVRPAVVSVRAILPTPRPSPWDIFEGQNEGTPESFGTGFILRSDGIVLTNQHVIANATQITVTLSDGTDADGKLLGADPVTDIAVIKINRTNLPVVTIGKSSDLMIGEWAIALGNPYAYMLGNSEPTVTAGVISATGRNIVPTGDHTGSYLDMIQTDAAINPGNSGGPLVNALGEVVGVNSSIFSGTGESVGLGFAIPIERAVRIANEIVKSGTVHRAWVGFDVAATDQASGKPRPPGLTITQVVADGPAAKAGIHSGDVLLEADGHALHSYLDWEAIKLDLHVGDAVTVKVRSGLATSDVRIVTGELPTVTAERVKVLSDLELETVTPAIRAERAIQSPAGALVLRIPDALANGTGLHEGDVILGLNGQGLQTAEDVAKAFKGMQAGERFVLNIERGGMRGYLNLVFH
jgi:serine protease Do